MKSRLVLFAIVLSASCAALAATQWVDIERRLTADQMHATGLDTLSAEQLALLNRLLGGTTTPERAQDPTRFTGFNDAPIVSRLVGTLTGWSPGTEFELANGQRWKVLKGSYTLPKPLQAPEVKVAPGAAGRWFFRIDEDTPGARVYRID